MQLTTIKNALINIIRADTLLNQTNRIKLSADEEIGPALERFKDTFDNKLLSPVGKELSKELERYHRSLTAKTLFAKLLVGVTVIAREAALLEKSLDSDNIESVMREALNVKEAQIIQFITLADYYLEVVRALMVVIQEAEVYHLRGDKLERSSLKYIDENFGGEKLSSVASLLGFFVTKEKEEVVSKIYDLPDIKVDPTILSTIQSTEGNVKIDPAGFNPLNIFNPTFYAFTAQKLWSEIKFYRLEKAQKEMEYLELRHQELVLLREGRNNPALERKIGIYQDDIQTLRVKINRIKERMG